MSSVHHCSCTSNSVCLFHYSQIHPTSVRTHEVFNIKRSK
ncbi:hypothetical protein MY1_0699 [Nitrosarchaeum koreense MY1]|uniref:Uncharacterized protein n=1 Tax=Nitrosarchaeum koreense MY1 TaxID=1001994 RepID=F9CW10_9ARCH|nr:hypothetical protein MY1_0699 [Nitrosarchaeum koreense MY1]